MSPFFLILHQKEFSFKADLKVSKILFFAANFVFLPNEKNYEIDMG